jgi:DNA-binding response OmpR family regulator
LYGNNSCIEAICPIIYFSANKDVSKSAKEAGADDYLSKSLDISSLEGIVKKYVQEK